MKEKITVINEPQYVPIYDKVTGKFKGCRLTYNISETISVTRFFWESFWNNSYKKMCRFKNKLQVVNENNK